MTDADLSKKRRVNDGLTIASLLVLLGVGAALFASCSGSKPADPGAPTASPDPQPPPPEPQPPPPT